MNLPTDLQRLAPLLAVAVLAVVGLFLVTRMGGEEATVPPNPAPAKSSPAKPGPAKSDRPDGGSTKGNPAGKTAAKPSKQSYINCVQQAKDATALEQCQALVP